MRVWFTEIYLEVSLIFEGRIAKNLFEKSTQGQRISLRKSHEKIILLIPEYRWVANVDYARRLACKKKVKFGKILLNTNLLT